MKYKYSVQIAWSQEDKAFIATANELPGCAADGKSQEEALQNLEVIIDEWIETAKELGRETPPPMDISRIEEAMKQFQSALQQHLQREVQTAVGRILQDLARSQSVNPNALWITSNPGRVGVVGIGGVGGGTVISPGLMQEFENA